MKKKKGKVIRFEIPPWNSFIIVSVEQTLEDWTKIVNKNKYLFAADYIPSNLEKGGAHTVIDADGDPSAIRLSINPKKNNEAMSVLSHEVSHFVQLMLDSRGLTRTRDSEEAYAYTTSWLTKTILDKLYK